MQCNDSMHYSQQWLKTSSNYSAAPLKPSMPPKMLASLWQAALFPALWGAGHQLASVTIRDHSLLPQNPLLPKKATDTLQLMKASLLFDQDPQILEIMTTVLPAGLSTGFAYQLLPPSAPLLLALLLAGSWLFSRAARTQPEEALCRPGRRFSPCFGAEWWQRAFARPASLPSTVATSMPVTAGLGRAGAGCCMLANTPWLQFCTALLQTPSQRYLSIFCQKDTDKGKG